MLIVNRPGISCGFVPAPLSRTPAGKGPWHHRARASREGDLASDFSRYLNESSIPGVSEGRSPTPFMSPTAVIASQLSALQRNDYPEQDAGAGVAYAFTIPEGCEAMLPGGFARAARSWHATEKWLPPRDFMDMLHMRPYNHLLNCDSWAAISELVFPSSRTDSRAVQAVRVHKASQQQAFTFCLQRMEVGPYKGCWLTVGVRVGDYSV